jgi:deoxycytidine triphosphate deaminase
LPKNTVDLLLGRSSAAIKGIIIHPGVIDPDYEEEVKIMVSSPRGVSAISPEDRIAKILLLPSHHVSFPSRGTEKRK